MCSKILISILLAQENASPNMAPYYAAPTSAPYYSPQPGAAIGNYQQNNYVA